MSLDFTPDEPGIYRDVEARFYHGWRAFSITTGKELLRSPGHYLHRLMNPIEATPAMRLGTMVHARLLEPEKFADEYAFVPDHIPKDRRRKERQEWEREQTREIIESDQARRIEGIYQSVMGRSCAREILRGEGEQELSMLWDDESGVRCKGRLDKYHADAKLLVDIKTTQDASPVAFSRTICQWGYHIQAAHYLEGGAQLGLDIDHVIVVAIETEEPFGVAVYELPREVLKAGKEQRDKLLERLQKCVVNDDWSSYPDKVQALEFPPWAFSSIEKALGYT